MPGNVTDRTLEVPRPRLCEAKGSAVTANVRHYAHNDKQTSDIEPLLIAGSSSSTDFCDTLQARGLWHLSEGVQFVIDPPEPVAHPPPQK
jgi:hypothetical protein